MKLSLNFVFGEKAVLELGSKGQRDKEECNISSSIRERAETTWI